jgi:glutamate 5-kinase
VLVVVKVGTSSLTDEAGALRVPALEGVAAEVAEARRSGHEVVVVTSGAIAIGAACLLGTRPTDLPTLQALAAVGQPLLAGAWGNALGAHGLAAAQILLAPYDFAAREQYLHARQTLRRLLELSVVPVVNENDAVADDEIRFGDNDRLAALVAQLLGAGLLVLLTDTPGVLGADPRLGRRASLIEEVADGDDRLAAAAAGPGSERGSGGMASKVAAARMAAWAGVRAVIGPAERPGILAAAIAGAPGVGTTVRARARRRRLPARKLWIAFALPASGRVVVDEGARRAIVEAGASLLPAGVRAVEGVFGAGDAVEVVDREGALVAKGLVRFDAEALARRAGTRSADGESPGEAIHRDDLVLLAVPERAPGGSGSSRDGASADG